MVYYKFTPVNWRDIYSVLGYLAQWALQRKRPTHNHVAIGWGDTYYALSCNKGVAIELLDGTETLVPAEVTRDYVQRIVDVCLYNHIRWTPYFTCIQFAATCAGLHRLRFRTADAFYDALTEA